ncbi:PAS domain-containing protein [Salinibacter ruber]|uniref:histidine kinase n=1 Tax=Salinibacter ruber TaxID=146919 RepID=A0A9X2R913_9BACT|nr:PAS domain-containing protein [Salinibacter ruber]MCS3857532.1 PAS domain S-box-containing protein [Salinibacter ruber]MCS3864357.1 PAS domain S-box-containing protein [Salinibacter ruber]MCS4150465.1 PAS domain S-box-containing protein [Salinibacter ruber]MCS4177223.1 PAS domain S-box-containing protein [Salinibacter ruber]
MSNASSPGSEQDAEAPIFRMDEMEEQLDVLRRHDVFEGRLEGAFDRMTRVAADLFDAEAAFVVFLNSSQQWLEDRVGLGRSACRAVAAWCTRVAEEDTPLVVDRTRTDTASDVQTQEGEPDFYAGVPVHVSAGTCIGVCAIVDSTPRSFSDSQKRRLGDVGQMISENLEQRRQAHKHEDLAQERAAVCRRYDAIRQDPDMMLGVVEADGTLLETNETSLQYIEAGRDEVLGEPFWETPWWDEEDRERVRAWIDRAAEGEYVTYQAGSDDARSRSYRVEGAFRPVIGTGKEGEEQVEALVVSARDVTERERRLRQAEVLFQNAQDAFFLLDVREGGEENTFAYRRVNPVYEKKFGHSEEEIRGRSPEDVFGEELGQFLEERCRTCARRGESLEYEEEIPLAGRPTYWFTRIAPVFVEGEVQQIVGHATEITERKRRKERIERQNDLFQRAQEIANVGAWEYDVKTGDLRATRQTYRIHGYPVEKELTAEEAFSHYHPEDQAVIENALEQAVEDGASYDLELRLQTETGTERWVRDRGEPQWEDGEVARIRGTLRDITDRKKRERRLRQIETLFQNAQEPLFLLDVQEDDGTAFRIERINPAYEEKFGRTTKGVLGASPEEVFGEKFGKFMTEKCAECVRRGEALQYEEKIPLDGAITYWKTRIAPVMGAGDVQQIVGHATNVTDQKRRERTLRERQDKIEALYKTADRLIRAPSKETVGTVLVRLIRTALGYQAVAVRFVQDENLVVTEVSETNFEFMPERPDFRVDGDSPIAEVYRSGQTLVIGDVEEDIDDEDDRVSPPNYYGNPGSGVVVPVGRHGTLAVASQEPQAIGPFDRHLIEVLGSYAAVVLDQLGHEQSLRERQEKIEALYEATQRLLTAEELESVSTRIHELLEDVFDYPLQNTGFVDGESIVPDHTSAKHAVGVPPPERRSTDGDSLSAQALRAGDTVVIDDAGSLDNDVEYGALRTAAAVPIGERGVVVIGKTEVEAFDPFNLRLIEVLSGYAALVLNRLDREATLRDAKEEAEEASRMKSALLANMSHEIRTPLTSIIGFAEVVGTEASTLDLPTGSPLPDCADRIERGGKRLLDTLEGVLNLSKLEAGQMELDAEPVPLISEVQRVAEELQPKAREKEIDLRLETESAWAEADEGGVQIIARNLLSNAIKYTEADGTVWVRSYRADGRAVLEVEDTGIGMAPEAVDDLFEPFRQASEGFSREYEGTGVGLAVTKRAAEEMDGSVDVDTEEGEGSRFTVRLPTAGGGEASENGERTL